MSKEKNVLMDVKFNELTMDVQMDLLGLTEDVMSQPRFKNLPIEDVIKDVWNSRTNSQKRIILKEI